MDSRSDANTVAALRRRFARLESLVVLCNGTYDIEAAYRSVLDLCLELSDRELDFVECVLLDAWLTQPLSNRMVYIDALCTLNASVALVSESACATVGERLLAGHCHSAELNATSRLALGSDSAFQPEVQGRIHLVASSILQNATAWPRPVVIHAEDALREIGRARTVSADLLSGRVAVPDRQVFSIVVESGLADRFFFGGDPRAAGAAVRWQLAFGWARQIFPGPEQEITVYAGPRALVRCATTWATQRHQVQLVEAKIAQVLILPDGRPGGSTSASSRDVPSNG